MSEYTRQLASRQTDPAGRRWLFVPYDQLNDRIGPLSREDPRSLGVVLVDSVWKARRRPYHKQKLALVMTNVRHFALEQAARGVAVRHILTFEPYAAALRDVISHVGPLRMQEAAERELRADLAPLVTAGLIEVLPHEGWLTTPQQFHASQKRPPWRMDRFYAAVRRSSGILMQRGKPLGGKFSFDAENRQPWNGAPPPAEPPRFAVDEITREVGEGIEQHYAHHPGALDLTRLPASAADAAACWEWAKQACLPRFGPFEDAMSTRSTTIFHTRLSALINLHRLLPTDLVREADALDAPLPSREGFIRQVLGWREFVRHVHVATDGFRDLPGSPPVLGAPGDGGYARWSGSAWQRQPARDEPDGGAVPSAFAADGEADAPPALWGRRCGMNCLDAVVADVWRESYSHHITRLMVISNIATLLDVSPRALTDWFWVAYADAFDWVVEPNVLGMGTYAVGDLMTTKPYVSGAAYLHKMSDYCNGCRFDPKRNCPITPLYWAFLARHAQRLRDNQRLRLPLAALSKREPRRRAHDQEVFACVRDTLQSGAELRPESLPRLSEP